MIDRRGFMAGSVATGVAGAAWSRTGARAGEGARTRAIDAIVLPAGFNGVMAHGRDGRIGHIRCVGMADVEAGVPVTPATAYRWGSASKWLVSTAVLRLAEQGRIMLDAPIATYLPDFRADTGQSVRVWHLLSNTSGIPDQLTQRIGQEPELRTSSASAATIVERFGSGAASFPPGAGWDYAALNWAIVAALLERVTGESVPVLVERLVFAPLAMTGAGFVQTDRPAVPGLAAAYGEGTPPRRKMAPVPPFLAASGNVAGTVADAVRAAHGIFHGGLIGRTSRRALTAVRWPAEEYALGGRVHSIDGVAWAWETGKVQGYRTHIAHRLDRSETIVVFNTTDMAQPRISQWVEAIARA